MAANPRGFYLNRLPLSTSANARMHRVVTVLVITEHATFF